MGNANIAIEARINNPDIITNPNHQAPTKLGSDESIFECTDKSAYTLVHKDPTINPKAGPRIRTPIVMAENENKSIKHVGSTSNVETGRT